MAASLAKCIGPRHQPGRPEQIATRIVFFISGFGMAAWAPLVPFAKARAGLDDGLLGLLLLCLGGGSVVAMPLAGASSARRGCRFVLVAAILSICAALPFLATAASFPLLAAALFVFGAGVGAMDVSMNVQAIIVERASGRAMMSGFHGLFSLGGIVGAAGVTAALGLGASPLGAVLGVAGVIVAALGLAVSHLLSYGSRSGGPLFAWPRGVVVFIGMLCFIIFMMEGSVLDWSAVFLTSVHGLSAAQAGLGYTAFALTMTIGRLTGDRIVQRLGGIRIIALGGTCAAAGVGLTLLPWTSVALAGYALVGVGCSNIVPVLFTSVGRQTVMPETAAVASITTLGYAGILLGPAGIGFIAHRASLPAAFAVMAVLLVGVAVSSRFLRAALGGR